jgi:hypothetical protein
MVLLTITPNILSTLESLSPSLRDELSLPNPELNTPISHTQLITLSRYFTSQYLGNDLVSFADRRFKSEEGKEPNGQPSEQGQESSVLYSLNTLLRGVKLFIPPPLPKPEPVRLYLV